jgi:cytoskeletal protein CcmA (bactofilin family)
MKRRIPLPDARRGALRRWLQAAFCVGASLALTSVLGAEEEKAAPSNVYMTGAEVRIDRPVAGDLVTAAGRIHIDHPVTGDAVLAAGSIDVQSAVREDLRAAGGIVTLAGPVGHEVLIVAGRIILTPAADVHGETWLAAADVTLAGRVAEATRIYARSIRLSGEIRGPAELSAERIDILAGAHVHGDIVYSSAREITIDPRARVDGKVIRRPKKLDAGQSAKVPGLKPLRPLAVAALLALGILALALFPRVTTGAVRTLMGAPGKSLGLGTALFFSVPPIAVLLVITLIGIPIGIALIAAYAIGLLLGYVVSAALVGHALARSIGRPPPSGWHRYAFVGAAMLLLVVATSIEYLGPVLLWLACSFGLGALVLQRFSRHSVLAGRDEWRSA